MGNQQNKRRNKNDDSRAGGVVAATIATDIATDPYSDLVTASPEVACMCAFLTVAASALSRCESSAPHRIEANDS